MIALGVGGVGGHGDRARRHDAEVGDAPFGPVLGDQHHPVAAARSRSRASPPPRSRPRRAASRHDSRHAMRPPALWHRKRRVAQARRLVEEHRDQIGIASVGTLSASASFGPAAPAHRPTARPRCVGSAAAAPPAAPPTRSTALALSRQLELRSPVAHRLQRRAHALQPRALLQHARRRWRTAPAARSRPARDSPQSITPMIVLATCAMIVGPPAAPTATEDPAVGGVDHRRRHRDCAAACRARRGWRGPPSRRHEVEIGQLVVEEEAARDLARAEDRLRS